MADYKKEAPVKKEPLPKKKAGTVIVRRMGEDAEIQATELQAYLDVGFIEVKKGM